MALEDPRRYGAPTESSAPIWQALMDLPRFHRVAGQWVACCPAHPDRNPSLAIKLAANGDVLLFCHAGCQNRAIVTELGYAMSDLFSGDSTPHGAGRTQASHKAQEAQEASAKLYPSWDALPDTWHGGRLVDFYNYEAADGSLAYVVRRYEKPAALVGHKPDKECIPFHPVARGQWALGLPDERVLLNLPHINGAAKDTIIYLLEGEKTAKALHKALAAASLPGVVTTTVGGSEAGDKTPVDALAGHRVVILPDSDAPGRKYAKKIAERAQKVGAAAVAILEFDGLPEKGDFVEWQAAGHTAEELATLATERLKALARFQPLGVRLSEVKPEQVRWLWPGRIPLGKVATLDGDPGLGKSTLTAEWAACVTNGRAWPDGSRCEPGGVVLLSAEDDAADTIRPRLDAAGANPAKVYHLTGVAVRDDTGAYTDRDVYLPGDLPVVEAAIEQMAARLVVIDPIMAYLSSDVNSHRDQDVRGALRPLAALAGRTGAAIVLVRHLNKAMGGSALYRGGGSIGIIGAARAGLLVAPDPDDPESGKPNGRRVLAVVKSNLSMEVPSLTFHVMSAPDNPSVGVIEWGEVSNRTANDLMSQPTGEEERSERTDAEAFLSDALADGERPAIEVSREARSLGISDRTLARARKALGVRSERRGGTGADGAWYLSLPATPSASAKDANHRAKDANTHTSGILSANAHDNAAADADSAYECHTLGNGSVSGILSDAQPSTCERPANCARRTLATGRTACGLCDALHSSPSQPSGQPSSPVAAARAAQAMTQDWS